MSQDKVDVWTKSAHQFFVITNDKVAQPVDFGLFSGSRHHLQVGAGELDRRLFTDAFFDEFDVGKDREQRFLLGGGQTRERAFFAFFAGSAFFLPTFSFFFLERSSTGLIFHAAQRAFGRRHRRSVSASGIHRLTPPAANAPPAVASKEPAAIKTANATPRRALNDLTSSQPPCSR